MSGYPQVRFRTAQTFMLNDQPQLLLPLKNTQDIADLHAWADEAQMELGELVYMVITEALARDYGAQRVM